MNKYLCIDTNIFIQCCLLEISEADDFRAVDALLNRLEVDSLKLLLPEVVILEFNRKIEEKSKKIEGQIAKHKESIGRDSDLDEKIKKDMLDGLTKLLEGRLVNKEKVTEKIAKIFNHKNTIKEGLNITSDSLVESYKSFLKGEKPCKSESKSHLIQADCVIIQILKNFFLGKTDYELYFCSLNSEDFAETNPADSVQPPNPKIHADIKKLFSSIEYRTNVLALLKEKFDADISVELIGKFDEVTGINEFNTKIEDSIEGGITAESAKSESDLVGENTIKGTGDAL